MAGSPCVTLALCLRHPREVSHLASQEEDFAAKLVLVTFETFFYPFMTAFHVYTCSQDLFWSDIFLVTGAF